MDYHRGSGIFSQGLAALVVALAFLLMSAPETPAQTPPGGFAHSDGDRDGLPDLWELEQAAVGLSPRKANLILVPVIRPNMRREMVQPALNKVVEFFARLPIRNLDGSTGIGVVIRWGNTLPDSDRESETPCCTASCRVTHYADVRARGMPAAWIGKGHGLLIGSCTGGGGQEGGPDWAGVSNLWWVMVHELGHQLGLQHEPRGTGIPSPIYTSLMNYDYSYQFNDDPNAVRFSTGQFRSLSLDETNLNETLPFAIGDLQFLSHGPYNYSLRAAGPAATSVDFNRNGVFGERGLRVDINGGSGLTARDRVDFERTAGGFTLTALGDQLVAVYSDLPTPPSWGSYNRAGLSVGNPGRLRYQVYSGGRVSTPLNIGATGVTGDPHAIVAFGKLFLTFPMVNGPTGSAPTFNGYAVHSYQLRPDGRLQLVGFALERSAPSSHPVLVRTSTPEELYLFIWDEATKRVRYRRVMAPPPSSVITLGPVLDLNMGFTAPMTPIVSNSPVGVAWNSKLERIALMIAERDGRFQGRMKLIHLGQITGGWYGQNQRWVGGATGNPVATLSRPTILFDDRPSAGVNGQYLIYNLLERSGSDAVVTEAVRLTMAGIADRWTEQLMMNIWTTSRSAPSATLYRDDVAWGWRVDETRFPAVPNILQIFLRASGITDSGMTDFDDVTWIATRGMVESLQHAPR